MITSLIMALCGASGAVTYSFPLYLKALGKEPPVKFALVNLGFSVFVGTVCSVLFTRAIGGHFHWTVEPEPWPLAMVIGLGSNPIVPILIRKMEKWASAFEGLRQ
jgi:drug/metabolite transporter (DMT)-like permease